MIFEHSIHSDHCIDVTKNIVKENVELSLITVIYGTNNDHPDLNELILHEYLIFSSDSSIFELIFVYIMAKKIKNTILFNILIYN